MRPMERIKTLAILSLFFVLGVMAVEASNEGQELYINKCAGCHGKVGEGTMMAPQLSDSEFIRTSEPDIIGKVITEGREKEKKKYSNFSMSMPKFDLDKEDAGIVIEYIIKF